MSWSDQRDAIAFGYLSPGDGHFGLTKGRIPKTGPISVSYWESCREVFHNKNRKVKRFYFCHDLPKGRGRSVSVFFDKVEDRLNLAPEDRCRFGPTDKREVMWVEMSDWWKTHSMRRSLFTALLRQSVVYRIHQDNFEEALYDIEYTGNTRAALDHFLAGNVWYHGNEVGWLTAFDADYRDELDELGKVDHAKRLKSYRKPLGNRKRAKNPNPWENCPTPDHLMVVRTYGNPATFVQPWEYQRRVLNEEVWQLRRKPTGYRNIRWRRCGQMDRPKPTPAELHEQVSREVEEALLDLAATEKSASDAFLKDGVEYNITTLSGSDNTHSDLIQYHGDPMTFDEIMEDALGPIEYLS